MLNSRFKCVTTSRFMVSGEHGPFKRSLLTQIRDHRKLFTVLVEVIECDWNSRNTQTASQWVGRSYSLPEEHCRRFRYFSLRWLPLFGSLSVVYFV